MYVCVGPICVVCICVYVQCNVYAIVGPMYACMYVCVGPLYIRIL